MSKKKRIFFETEEVITKTRRGYIDLETDYFQFYTTAFHFLASLSNNCARDFILWVMTKVDNDNRFTYGKDMYLDFMESLSGIPKPKTYSEVYMYEALKELVDQKIIAKSGGRGQYRVNPKLFWSDDTSKRITAIKNIEANSRVEVPVAEGNVLTLPEPTYNEQQ